MVPHRQKKFEYISSIGEPAIWAPSGVDSDVFVWLRAWWVPSLPPQRYRSLPKATGILSAASRPGGQRREKETAAEQPLPGCT